MAQLESGKIYYIDRVGVYDYLQENNFDYNHTTEEYFLWFANKFTTALGITDPEYTTPKIIEGEGYAKHCFLPLPYINDPTNNKLQLYMKCSSQSGSIDVPDLTPLISYSNNEDYFIPQNNLQLPFIGGFFGYTYRQKDWTAWQTGRTNDDDVKITSGYRVMFIIDTTFLDSCGFYTIEFFKYSNSITIEEIALSPGVFICDMIDTLTKKNSDGVFRLSNTFYSNGYKYNLGHVLNDENQDYGLGLCSIAAIGLDDDKYALQGFIPQIFPTDFDGSYSMIKVCFGQLKTFHNIYITMGNSSYELIKFCNIEKISEQKSSWYKNAFQIKNNKYHISINCRKSTFDNDQPNWVIIINEDEKPQPEVKGCLKFSSDGDFVLYQRYNEKYWDGIIEYSIDDRKTWNEWNGEQLSGTKSQSIYLRGINNTQITGENLARGSWYFSGKCVEGNIETLLDYQTNKHTINKYCYSHLFYDNTNLIDASKLIIKNVSKNSCFYMFNGCRSLTKAPKLQATTLAPSCYSNMFGNCRSLTKAPELPATTLAYSCYTYMFAYCSSLIEVPELPATILADYCYNQMFNSCTSLIEAPKLPATTLADYCYYYMFNNCKSLTKVPELPATTLASHCYSDMFIGCSSLVETHKTLPALTLADGCYHSMYYNCSSIVKTYKNLLPATTLANDCYRSMFSGCSSLKNVPKLPAIILADYCYYYMFYNCISLEEISELPATTLKIYCYCNMFRKCSKIKLSTSKTGIYTNNYRIPSAGSGTNASYALNIMFYETGGSFANTPTINTTYYTSNEVI